MATDRDGNPLSLGDVVLWTDPGYPPERVRVYWFWCRGVTWGVAEDGRDVVMIPEEMQQEAESCARA